MLRWEAWKGPWEACAWVQAATPGIMGNGKEDYKKEWLAVDTLGEEA